MNISSAASQNSVFGLNNQVNPSKKSLVRSTDPATELKPEQDKPSKKQPSQAIVIDQQAIELFEKNQFEATVAKPSTYNDTYASPDKDQPSFKNESAVSSYQAVGNLAQRESVQKLFGVDLFA